jgi:hypothetical protein
MVKPGNYVAWAVSKQLGRASTGNPQIGVSYRIARGEHEGEEVPWYGSLGSLAAIKQTVRALRESGARIKVPEDFKVCAGLGGRLVPISVEETENEETGELGVRVRWVGSGGVPMRKESRIESEEDLERLTAHLRKSGAFADAEPEEQERESA